MGKSPDSIGDEGIVAPREVTVPAIAAGQGDVADTGTWPVGGEVYWQTMADCSRTGEQRTHVSFSIEGRYAPTHIAEQNAMGGFTHDQHSVPMKDGGSKDLPGNC